MDAISIPRTYTTGRFAETTLRIREVDFVGGMKLRISSVNFMGQVPIDIFVDGKSQICITFVDQDGEGQEHVIGKANSFAHIHPREEEL